MEKRAAIYLRSSKDRHDVSVESQKRELEKFILAQGDSIEVTFIDKVESAKNDDRPAFQEMFNEVKAKKPRFNIIYCYDTSRFSRRQYDAQAYKFLLKKNSIELVFLKLPKTNSIIDPIIESIMESFDEFHSQKSKMDGLRGMRENINQGYRAGGRAPKGYILKEHVVGTSEGNPITKTKLIPDPTCFNLIQKYLKRRAKGISRQIIIKELNLDIPNTTLHSLEKNILPYQGHTVWNRHNEIIDSKYVGGNKFRDKSEWVIKHNTHQAMISDEEAGNIQKINDKHKHSKHRHRATHYLLSGFIKCMCGGNLHGDSGYYRCQNRCGVKGIKQETLEKSVLDSLFETILTPEFLDEFEMEIQKHNLNQPSYQLQEKNSLKKELKAISDKTIKIVNLLSQVQHERPLLQQLDLLEEERIKVEEKLEKKIKENKHEKINVSRKTIDRFVKEYRDNLYIGDPQIKKNVIQSIIESGTYDGDVLKIKPSYQKW